jgi:hypothetical protein
MSRLRDPGCMLRALSAAFGALFLPVGVSFFFVLRHRHWLQGVGAVAAALGFFYVAWRAHDILGLDSIEPGAGPGRADRVPPQGDRSRSAPDPPEPDS